MTTIAYNHKDKQIAYDSRCTAADVIMTDALEKKFVIGDAIYFMSGSTCDFELFFSEFKHGVKPSVDLDCYGICVINGVATFRAIDANTGLFFESKREYNFTIGTGSRFALAAMDLGKSAKEAVEYAATRDIYTGGEIKVYQL